MSVQNTEYENLVRLLEESSETKVDSGVEILIKRIPDLDSEGDFDPRVLENVKKQRTTEQGSTEKSENNDLDIEAVRAKMGWANKDVTKHEIRTEALIITGRNGDIPIRIYSPVSDSPLPAVVYFHGGGFIGGTLETVENPCKALAEKANAVVVSVDYRLAPENPFPAGLYDCFDAITWVYNHPKELGIDREQIAVAGDSAGGNLATVCCLLDHEQQTNMIKYQALIYPVVNIGDRETEDYKWDIEEYKILHNHELIRSSVYALAGAGPLFNELYLQGVIENSHPHVSPLLAEDLSGLPDTLIITAEYDFLRLEGEAYARKLARSGVKVKLIQYNGMDHAFIDKIGEYPQAEDCMNEIAKGIRSVFNS
ncbi:acetyl esterase/lipase [Bacillus mesophilus]|uniref:Alpha/beta hydrolase n=1 Tax=Bacillus mesophilus TaxID=1808955 RepID=A0A6M0QAZ9_9BACI|nr:alpha/beta hydrolase [Bacillus mesophilus]MBM7662837.1 acetyl esterase/lipase [Bacillus mesophilus]NEY73427.1 alpha/beta hydrolase [Bacillus mesophilus]